MNKNEMLYHFGEKALNDAMLTGDNHIFLSATPLQSEMIRKHVLHLASSQGLTVKGNPIVLPNGAMLVFLLTNSETMGGWSGHAYAINCFDETNFSYIHKLVSAWTADIKYHSVFYSFE
ncbi:hypothetical protein A6E04_19335 [Aliivibrio logei]|uniref:Uncharacterized protein n=2 Tax=Aliivibrio logei TaxID=688 RepID=A0A1B9NTQ1_ALILO|nr:hypothetical protein A6E04_19335 [Aliivibrio logei]